MFLCVWCARKFSSAPHYLSVFVRVCVYVCVIYAGEIVCVCCACVLVTCSFCKDTLLFALPACLFANVFYVCV